MAVDPQRQLGRILAGALGGLAIEMGHRRETRRLAADDRQRQRQPERAGARDRLRRAADGDPDRQRVLQRARIDAEDRRAARRSRPLQVTRSDGAQLEQQFELLGEQFVVVVEVVAEQRKRLDERAAPRHDLGAAAG